MRGKNFGTAEQDVIRLLLRQNKSIRQIASVLGRSVAGVHGQVKKMEANGSIQKDILDLGQADERK